MAKTARKSDDRSKKKGKLIVEGRFRVLAISSSVDRWSTRRMSFLIRGYNEAVGFHGDFLFHVLSRQSTVYVGALPVYLQSYIYDRSIVARA